MPGEVTAPRAEEHLGLVHLCANRFRNRGIEYDELYSAGCVGLLKAIKAFDCGRGVQFSTYAVPVILGEIKRLFRDGGIVHVSRSLRERAMKLQKLQEEFEQRYGRSPTMTELNERSGESIEACGEALCVTQTPLSLTRNEDDEEDGQFDIPVEAPDRQIGDLLSLRQLMGALPEKRPDAPGAALFSGTDPEQDRSHPGHDAGAGLTPGEKTIDTTAAGTAVVDKTGKEDAASSFLCFSHLHFSA